jgi:hypothetical protein
MVNRLLVEKINLLLQTSKVVADNNPRLTP